MQNCCVPGTTLQGPQSWYREQVIKLRLFHIRVMPKSQDILTCLSPGSLRSAHVTVHTQKYRYPESPGVFAHPLRRYFCERKAIKENSYRFNGIRLHKRINT